MSHLSHAEWLARVEKQRQTEIHERRKKKSEELHEKKQRKQQGEKHFSQWATQKDNYIKAKELLSHLSKDRGDSKETYGQIAVCLGAVDRSMKIGWNCDCETICDHEDHKVTRQKTTCTCPRKKCFTCNRCVSNGLDDPRCSKRMSSEGVKLERPCSCPIRSLGENFYEWMKVNARFDDVEISPTLLKKFSTSFQNSLEDEDGKMILSSLSFARNPPLSSDDKLRNALFHRLTIKHWREMGLKMEERMKNLVVRKFAPPIESESKTESKLSEEPQPPAVTFEEIPTNQRAKLEQAALYHIGLRKLKSMVEQDSEKKEKELDDDKAEAKKDAKIQHEAWAENKMKNQIILPKHMELPKPKAPPRMDFSKKGVMRKQKEHCPKSSLEVMLRQNVGTRIVHAAVNDEDDLLRSRQLLLSKGVVIKKNFTDPFDGEVGPEQETEYRQQLRNNEKRLKTKEKIAKRQKMSEKSFEEWNTQKSMRTAALRCLDVIPSPAETLNEDSRNSLVREWEHEKGIELWVVVGKALKAIDRALFDVWLKWTGEFKSHSQCLQHWNHFEPRSCDLHSNMGSNLRSTFLKLLHAKKINFKEAFEITLAKRRRRNEEKSLTKREFGELIKSQGLVLTPPEHRAIADAFDTNNDGSIDMEEFISFFGEKRGSKVSDAHAMLEKRCIFEEVCHECGMVRAFEMIPSDDPKSKSTRAVRNELPDHSKFCATDLGKALHKGTVLPQQCQVINWTQAKKQEGLSSLQSRSATNQLIKTMTDLSANGQPPKVPKLLLNKERGRNGVSSDSLFLKWEAAKGSQVNFFVLECAGPDSDQELKDLKWEAVLQDPEKPEQPTSFGHTITSLKANTGYHFRLRAFNIYGGSQFIHRVFATSPLPPVRPEVLKITSKSVTLSWAPALELRMRMEESALLYEQLAQHEENTDKVDRERFMERISQNNGLKRFLMECPASSTMAKGSPAPAALGQSIAFKKPTSANLSVWELLESDPQAPISWTHFRALFKHQPQDKAEVLAQAGMGNTSRSVMSRSVRSIRSRTSGSAAGGPRAGNTALGISRRRALPRTSLSMTQASKMSRTSAVNDVSKPKRGDDGVKRRTKYALLRCVNDQHNEYDVVNVGYDCTRTINALEPGCSYKFAVVAINRDNVESDRSESAVVSTLLKAPTAPTLHSGSSDSPAVTCTSIKLSWGSSNHITGKTGGPNQSVDRILHDWANKHAPEIVSQTPLAAGLSRDRGVSLYRAFKVFDTDESGFISRSEFENMLKQLGSPLTGWRLEAAFDDLDSNGDNQIDFNEFHDWWKRADSTFVLKRDDGISLEHPRVVDDKKNSNNGNNKSIAYKSMVDPGSKILKGSKSKINAGPPAHLMKSRGYCNDTAYRGEAPGCLVTNLLPNTRYEFKLRTYTAHSQSAPSPSFFVSTRPSPPSACVVVREEPTVAILKWYPGEYGHNCKYVVEMQELDRLPSSTSKRPRTSSAYAASVGRKPSMTSVQSLISTVGGERNVWSVVYEGRANLARVSNLITNTVYRVRCYAINEFGTKSEASAYTQVVTPERIGFIQSSPKTVDTLFTLECEDIVTGDSLLFTENIYIKSDGTQTKEGGTDSNFIGTRTVAAQVLKSSYLKNKRSRKRSNSTSRPGSAGLGESMNGGDTMSVGSLGSRQSVMNWVEAGKPDFFSLEVVWSKVSKNADAYNLKVGQSIKRSIHDLFRYDIYRMAWSDERSRLTADEELKYGAVFDATTATTMGGFS